MPGDVAHLQHLPVVHTGLYEGGRHVNHESQPRKAAATLEEATQVVGKLHAFARDAVDRGARLEHIGIIEALHRGVIAVVRLCDQIDGSAGVVDHADLVAQGEVHRRDTELICLEGRDHQGAGVELGLNRITGQHGHRAADDIVSGCRTPSSAADLPLAIGHRGCAGEAPENTLPSFERALACGADILESDLHLTQDGVPVMIHDDRVDRRTNGRGRVRDHDLEDLQRLDAGEGAHIPSLPEALDAFPTARFNLELKEDVPGLVDATLGAVDAAGRAADVLLTAELDPLMARVREAVATRRIPVALGACLGEVVEFVQAAAEMRPPATPPTSGPMALQIPARFGERPLATPALIEHAHQYGVQVHVWTVNAPDEIRALLEIGVDGIVSDFPARAWSPRARGSSMSTGAPSALVTDHLEALRDAREIGPVLDLACGRGRHALALARSGIATCGVDRSAESLTELRENASRESLPVSVAQVDLESGQAVALRPGRCGAILVFRYLHRPIVRELAEALAPGGLLLYETFTLLQRELGYGPTREEFLLKPRELPELFGELEIEHHWEGLLEQPREAFVAQLVARRPR